MSDEDEYTMAMPFVAVASNGGDYDDTAYVAGYELGILHGQLAGPDAPTPERPGPAAVDDWRWINKGNADQVDLLAMKYHKVIEYGETFEDLVAVRVVTPA